MATDRALGTSTADPVVGQVSGVVGGTSEEDGPERRVELCVRRQLEARRLAKADAVHDDADEPRRRLGIGKLGDGVAHLHQALVVEGPEAGGNV